MPATRRWVIGRGLLGSAVADAGRDDVFSASIAWSDPRRALEDLEGALEAFALDADAIAPTWEIYWCAGKGVTSTSREHLQDEVDVFAGFVDLLLRQDGLNLAHGRLFVASSVGGVYAGRTDPPFTESTPPAPLTPYGDAKLQMEQVVRAASEASPLRTLVGRITNLYGPGQDLSKGQGLLSVIVSSYVTGRPTSVYVPLDTLRDYLYADDCAAMVTTAMRRLGGEDPGTSRTKIFGSMTPASIGAVIGEASRIRRVRAPIVAGQGDASGQASDLRVRSEVWTDIDGLARTTLAEGMSALYRAQLRHAMVNGTPAAR